MERHRKMTVLFFFSTLCTRSVNVIQTKRKHALDLLHGNRNIIYSQKKHNERRREDEEGYIAMLAPGRGSHKIWGKVTR